MLVTTLLGAALSALLLASSLPQPAASRETSQIAAAAVTSPSTAPPEAQPGSRSVSVTRARLPWYADPIILAFTLAALFAAIDIAILITKQAHVDGRQHAVH